MPRPFTRIQTLENAAFVKALTRTGNIRLAAREIGVAYGTLQHRRAHHPAFAQRWDAAIAMADARLHAARGRAGPAGGGVPAPSAKSMRSDGLASQPASRARVVSQTASLSACDPLRTRGGETVTVRRRDGTLQIRRAQPGKLTRHCEQAFLAALSATANVTLSAAAAGASPRAFYRRRRQNPAFEREMRLALEMGYERIELALLESIDPTSYADDAWRRNDPPPIPPMTVDQALQLLYLHQKEVCLLAEPPHIRRRRGESSDAHAFRLAAMYRERQRREHETFLIAEAERRARGEPWILGPEELPPLPALEQVTGWSNASGKPPHHEGVALFGGWRLGDMAKRRL